MFVSEDDYRVVIGETALKVVSQTSPQNREIAELEAIEEISGYLRPTYDVKAVFGAVGDDRNRLIVMYTADIALYHMVASSPQKMGSEIRKERYDRAIKWLEGVQAGKIVPDLPAAEPVGSDEYSGAGTLFFSDPKLNHNW